MRLLKLDGLAPGFVPLLLISLVSCDNPGTPPAPLTVTPAPLSLTVGESQVLSAAGAKAEVVWSSSNESVATVVSSTGMVTGAGPGTAQITATSGRQSGQVTVNVVRPEVAVSAANVSFTATVGQASPPAQTVNVTNSAQGTLSGLSGVVTYAQGQPSEWLAAALSSATAPATLTLTTATGTLSAGTYNATVTIRSSIAGVPEKTVNVTLTVAQRPTIGLSATSVSFAAPAGGANPPVQTVEVTNTGGATLTDLGGIVNYGEGQPTGWLSAALSSTTAPAILTLAATTGSLPAGTYNATITVRSSVAEIAEKTIEVTFAVAGTIPSAAKLEEVARGLTPGPVYLTSPVGDNRPFVATLDGKIRIVQQSQVLSEPFLDLGSKVRVGNYTGLFSFAFHPNYASNGFFYVYYINRDGDIHIERHQASADRSRADAASGKTLLIIKPTGPGPDIHYGGQLSFGPDGKLYMAVGDGGFPSSAQDKGSLLGKMVRIDVDAGEPYGIPSDNPFVGQAGARGEIWALGLRNPWRWSIDHQTGLIYIGDVGENRWEEINVVPLSQAGINYGWPIMEGTSCRPESAECNRAGLTLPTVVYPVSRAGGDATAGCSVTGGYVYRGSRLPGLGGEYFYGDYCRGWVRSFRYQQGTTVEPRLRDFVHVGRILSFGRDAAGELYILNDSGSLYQIVPESGS